MRIIIGKVNVSSRGNESYEATFILHNYEKKYM